MLNGVNQTSGSKVSDVVSKASKGVLVDTKYDKTNGRVALTVGLATNADGKQAAYPSSNFEKTGCVVVANFNGKVVIDGTECRVLGNILA